ncbi:MAG: hypothetical protein K8R67_04995, partial [Desulfobacteraceae bacterium]|nr:hypothetical protein [Desulfobacteraceae bacterium]
MANFKQEVSDDLSRMGKSFGSFIGNVGKGVAEAQKELDINSAEITKALANTEIQVPAVVEQVLDDDGKPTISANAVNIAYQKMSLIQFIVPTFYQWRHVQLNLSFDVEEIGTIEDFKIKKTRETGPGGIFGWGSRTNTSSSEEGTLGAIDTKQADGSLNARLEPRSDITPPEPFLFRTGPTINFIPGEDITDTVDQDKVIGAKLTIVVHKVDGEPNGEKMLKVSVNQGRYKAPSGLETNEDDGMVEI